MPFKTIGLGVIGYGAVKPAIDAANGSAFSIGAFTFALLVGVVLIGAATYVQNRMMEREDRPMDPDIIVVGTLGIVGFAGLGLVWLWAKREHKRLDRIK